MTYQATILRALSSSDRSGREVSIAAVGHESAIRSLKRELDMRISTVQALCRELGLEFYIGTPRQSVSVDSRGAEANAQYELFLALTEELENTLRDNIRDASVKVLARASGEGEVATRQVPVRELAAAAGGGAMELEEKVVGFVSFQRSWLDRHGLDPTQCTVINVSGESMEPTLPEGSKILVDYSQLRQRQGRIYVVRTSEGLVVKRAEKDGKGLWMLASDHPKWDPVPWGDSEIIGEVKWMGKTL